jgi:hypothetical protein
MRGRLSFALTACTLLFLLEGLAVLFATGFGIVHDAVFPQFRPLALAPLLLPLLAISAPALQVSRLGRYSAVAGTAILAAAARVPMSLPYPGVRFVAACVVVAAGATFLSCAVGFLERRSVAAGVGAAVVMDQLLRLAGWSWSISLRGWWVFPQLAISAAVVLLAVRWVRLPPPADPVAESSLERRMGGLRLRGAVALALILFLDMNVLARAEVAARWIGVRYEAAAVLLTAAGVAAVLVLLAGNGPLGRYRSWTAFLGLLATAGFLAAWTLPGWGGAVVMAAGHAAAILLVGRALVPSSGRRKGGTAVAFLAVLVVATTVYSASFIPGFSLPRLHSIQPLLFTGAGALMTLALMLLPRPVTTQPPLRRRLYAALAGVVVLAAAAGLAVRDRPERPDAPAGMEIRVASWNVRMGYGAGWRYDPAAIMHTIRSLDADIVGLQEVTAALPAAYGTDLGLYLSRRLGLRLHFAPARNRLMGDAILTRVHATGFTSQPLPARPGAARQVAAMRVPTPADTLAVYVTRLGIRPAEKEGQADRLARLAPPPAPAVLLAYIVVDTDRDDPALRAFRLAGLTPVATADGMPPSTTAWILLRGVTVGDVASSTPPAAYHPPVVATIRMDAPVRRASGYPPR